MPADIRRTERRNGVRGTLYVVLLGGAVLAAGALVALVMTLVMA